MEKEDWAAMRKLIAPHITLDPYQRAFETLRSTCNTRLVAEVDQIRKEAENAA